MNDYVQLSGTAQTPQTLPWDVSTTPRQPDEVLPLAEQFGITYPEDVKLVEKVGLPLDVYAAYLMPAEVGVAEHWPWTRFLNRFEQIVIRYRPDVLSSDEAIVAVFGHEAFELNGLFELLSSGIGLLSEQLAALINPGIPGNLHCRAWDDSDDRITTWRAAR